MKKFVLSLYSVSIICLFFYSYTQVDLSLTLSRISIWQTIEKSFQYIGYFQRPLSTQLFLGIVIILFLSYGGLLYLAKNELISRKTFWIIAILTAAFLTFSYNGFSYDIFNYIFDAKIFTHYHQNPYLHKALDFPGDPMLSFMQWTHRTYPYGPFWLILTVPLSFLGFNFFLPTFFMFKALASACFLGSVYLFEKILKKSGDKDIFNLIFYALNPLVLTELLISAHNDSAMLFLAIFGVYLLLEKKWFWGFTFVVLSALTKQATSFLIPISLIYTAQLILKKKYISENFFKYGLAMSMLIGYIAVATQIEIQPWYMLWFFPFFILTKPGKYVLSLLAGYSLGMILRYTGFFYYGNWNGIVPQLKLYVTIISPIVFLIVVFTYSKYRSFMSSKN